MRVLVTGGAGFIGSHVVDLLIERGFVVAVVDNLSNGLKKNLNSRAEFYEEDVRSKQMEAIFAGFRPQVVCHHAAQVSVELSQKKPLESISVNVAGTLNLLAAGRKVQIKQFILASSVAVYGEAGKLPIKETEPVKPMSIYGIGKAVAEDYVNLYRQWFRPVIFRYANVYGPRQGASAEGGVVAIFCRSLSRNRSPVIFGTGRQTRDFVFSGDVAQANLLAIKNETSGLFNISSGQETSVNRLFELCRTLSGKRLAAKKASARKGEIFQSFLANRLAFKGLAWRPQTDLKQGLKTTWDWFGENYDAGV